MLETQKCIVRRMTKINKRTKIITTDGSSLISYMSVYDEFFYEVVEWELWSIDLHKRQIRIFVPVGLTATR